MNAVIFMIAEAKPKPEVLKAMLESKSQGICCKCKRKKKLVARGNCGACFQQVNTELKMLRRFGKHTDAQRIENKLIKTGRWIPAYVRDWQEEIA